MIDLFGSLGRYFLKRVSALGRSFIMLMNTLLIKPDVRHHSMLLVKEIYFIGV